MKTKQTQPFEYKKAVIYCRVSSTKQKVEGHGLESQEQRCIKYAEGKGYEVIRVFKDDFTGGGDFWQRPGMTKLLNFLDEHSHNRYIVIFDDLKRFARDTVFHWKLRQALNARQAKPDCLNFRFEDSPEGVFVETILAAQGQLEKDQNKRQVVQKMKACLERGHWCFNPPKGLRNVKGILTADQPYANIYKEAIEKYKNFKLNSLTEVQKYILVRYSQLGIHIPLSLNGVKSILTEPLYAGYFEYLPWDVSFRKAEHEGFITYETYQAVQNRLNNASKPRLRKDYNEDFPVRGYALCRNCKKPLTASWFKGRIMRVPYYLCKTADCPRKNKMIKKDELEQNFVQMLKQVSPSPQVLNLTKAILMDVWQSRAENETKNITDSEKKIQLLQDQNQVFFDRVAKAKGNETIITGYEKRIESNNEQISKLKKESEKIKYSKDEFQTATEIVFDYLKNPVNQWDSGIFSKRRLLLGMYFEKKMTYHPETGFQTNDLPLILELTSNKNISKNTLVPLFNEATSYFTANH